MVGVSYTAESLEDIAEAFDKRAKECERQASICTVQKHAATYRAQSGVWSTAAEILRSTTLMKKDIE